MFNPKPEQENSTATAIKHGIQGRRSEQQVAGKITDIDGGESDESQPPSPSPPRNLRKIQKMVSEYLQTSMADSHKLSPTIWPTEKKFDNAKEKFKYEPGNLHIAVVGMAGTGKSTLVNSLRGLLASDPGATKTGPCESTMEAGRYPHPDKESPLSRIVWYDMPGVGVQSIPDSSDYFNTQGLFIFDFIIVVLADGFRTQELSILASCKMYNIPSFLVSSKADIKIQNIETDRDCSREEAHRIHIDETRRTLKKELGRAPKELGLDCDQEIYLVSKKPLRNFIKSLMDGKAPESTKDLIDEQSLVASILLAAQVRRHPTSYGMGWAIMRLSNLEYVSPAGRKQKRMTRRATLLPAREK